MSREYRSIDSTVAGLNQAMDAHFKWLVAVLRYIARRDSALPEITRDDAHRHCEFAQWLCSKLSEERDDKNFLLDIEKKHTEVHQSCRQLVNSIFSGITEPAIFDNFEKALLAFTTSITRYKIHLLQLRTSYDALTGLPSRRVLDESFESIVQGLSAGGLYLLLLDVDHFKRVNDNYGHMTGDIVLRSLALNLENNIRKSELVYRYGGEEFVILLQAESDKDASIAAERIREAIAESKTIVDGQVIKITITSGLTKVHGGDTLEEILDRADMAMYRGKQSGRNCCMYVSKNREITKVNVCKKSQPVALTG